MEARDIFWYYGGIIVLGILLFFLPRGRRLGMRLKLRGRGRPIAVDSNVREEAIGLTGNSVPLPDKFSRIQPLGERPLNVVFNYNGHSWDAYEVLGLPAGSGLEKVDQAFAQCKGKLSADSHAFLEAAYQAIVTQWTAYKGSG